MMDIGTKLKKIRVSEEMTMQNFADYLGVSICALRRWVCGDNRPSRLAMYRIIQVLGDKVGKRK